jgi:hypothetical protein
MILKSSMRAFALTLSLALPAWLAAQSAGSPPELAADAPDKHVVVRGDTLWGIAGKFLEKPWRWPDLWQLNKEQIRNPHLIYPGDIVYLDGTGPNMRLRLAKPVTGASPTGRSSGASPDAEGKAAVDGADGEPQSQRLSPRVRVQRSDGDAIPTISSAAIEPFLNRPLIIDEARLREQPRIVGMQEGRVYLGRGELAYVRGLKTEMGATEWYVYRDVKPLLDPDTRKPIAHEAVFLGSARLERRGDLATFRILSANEEIGIGDRLVPAERVRPMNFAPRAPDRSVQGRIVSVYRGVSEAGHNSVVALNLGARQGIEEGHVLGIQERRRQVRDPESRGTIALPGQSIGEVLVFRVFDTISYGLIVTSRKSANVGDDIVNP